MTVTPISFPSFDAMSGVGGVAQMPATTAVQPSNPTNGSDFGNLVLDGIDQLQSLTHKSDNLAVQAATGNLTNIHDYTIAASETQVATQLTTAVRNQALDAFNKILQMQV